MPSYNRTSKFKEPWQYSLIININGQHAFLLIFYWSIYVYFIYGWSLYEINRLIHAIKKDRPRVVKYRETTLKRCQICT